MALQKSNISDAWSNSLRIRDANHRGKLMTSTVTLTAAQGAVGVKTMLMPIRYSASIKSVRIAGIGASTNLSVGIYGINNSNDTGSSTFADSSFTVISDSVIGVRGATTGTTTGIFCELITPTTTDKTVYQLCDAVSGSPRPFIPYKKDTYGMLSLHIIAAVGGVSIIQIEYVEPFGSNTDLTNLTDN